MLAANGRDVHRAGMSLQAVIDAVMPRRCVFCGVPALPAEGAICAACRDDLPRAERRTAGAGPGIERVIAPLAYEFPVDAAIKAFKFRRRLYYAPAMAQLLCETVSSVAADVDAVAPVPLHWRRLWWRGFNQAQEIAGPLARELGVPLLGNVVRCRATRPQPGLTAAQRGRNLRGAFAVRGRLPHRHVLIVDDVITTGMTVTSLVAALRRAGVERVSVLAVATA